MEMTGHLHVSRAERTPGIIGTGGWVGPKDGRHNERKIYFLLLYSIQYTDGKYKCLQQIHKI